jgi:hypothetical protein
MGSAVVDIDDEYNTLLVYFLNDYRYVGDLNQIISCLEDLVHNRQNARLPDDWNYFWGVVIPRKDFVRMVDKEETEKIDFERVSDVEIASTWQGNVLLDAESVDTNCKLYLKFSTVEFIDICKEWELIKSMRKQGGEGH